MAGFLIPFENPFRRQLDLWSDPWGNDFGYDDMAPPSLFRGWYTHPRTLGLTPQNVASSQVSDDEKEFKVNLDVTHFKPNEISVKAADNQVTIEGKHEEREDDHGLIQRYFKRTYTLPKDVDSASLKSSLSADGVLTVAAPKKAIAAPEERQIAIQMAGGGDAKE